MERSYLNKPSEPSPVTLRCICVLPLAGAAQNETDREGVVGGENRILFLEESGPRKPPKAFRKEERKKRKRKTGEKKRNEEE